MKTTRLLFVFSTLTLGVAEMGLGLGLCAGLGMAGGTAQAVDVMAPYWAYQLQVGMRLGELRTFGGIVYRNVRIKALTPVQMQFSHSQGVQVELLTNIVDPNQYLEAAMAVPAVPAVPDVPQVPAVPGVPQTGGRGGSGVALSGHGPLALQMDAAVRRATGVDKLTDTEQQGLINWSRTGRGDAPSGLGLERLTYKEQGNMNTWLRNQQHQRDMGIAQSGGALPGPGPGPPIRMPVTNWINGDFTGFQFGRVYELGNGQRWKQVDNTTARYYPRRGGGATRVHIRASGSSYLMEVEGTSREVLVEPVR